MPPAPSFAVTCRQRNPYRLLDKHLTTQGNRIRGTRDQERKGHCSLHTYIYQAINISVTVHAGGEKVNSYACRDINESQLQQTSNVWVPYLAVITKRCLNSVQFSLSYWTFCVVKESGQTA